MVVWLTVAALGWLQGYRDAAAALTFALLVASVFLTARRLVSSTFMAAAVSEKIVRIAIAGFAIIVTSNLILGAAGRLTVPYVLGLQTLLWIASLWLRVPPSGRSVFDPSSIPAWFAGVAGALVAFAVAYAL